MIKTYNPIQGKFDRVPKKAPGTTIVLLDSRGASLYVPEAPQANKFLPPPSPESAPSSAVRADRQQEEPNTILNPEISEKLSRVGKAALKEGTKFVLWGSKKLLEGAKQTDWGAKLLAGDRSFYLVDVSKRSIENEFQVASKDSTLYFTLKVNCDVYVDDPAGVVSSGMVDVWSHCSTRLKRLLSDVGRLHSVHELAEARVAMQAKLDELVSGVIPFDQLIAISAITLDVLPDEGAAALVRTASEVTLKLGALDARSQVDAKAREVEKEAIKDPETMLAQWLQSGRQEYQAVLQQRLAGAQTQREQDRQRLEFMLEHGIIEPQDIHKRYPDLVGDLLALPLRGAGPPSIEDANLSVRTKPADAD